MIGHVLLITLMKARSPFLLRRFVTIVGGTGLAVVAATAFWYGLYRFQSARHVVPALVEHVSQVNKETERMNREFKHFQAPQALLPAPDEAAERSKIEIEGTYEMVAGVVALLGSGFLLVRLRRAASAKEQ